jgi:hypothetical protein
MMTRVNVAVPVPQGKEQEAENVVRQLVGICQG